MPASGSDQWDSRPLDDDDLEFVGQRLRSPHHRLKSRLAGYFEGYMEFVEMPPSPSPTESDTDDMTESTEDERQSHPRSMSPPSEPSQEQRKMDDHGLQRDHVDAHEYARLRRKSKPTEEESRFPLLESLKTAAQDPHLKSHLEVQSSDVDESASPFLEKEVFAQAGRTLKGALCDTLLMYELELDMGIAKSCDHPETLSLRRRTSRIPRANQISNLTRVLSGVVVAHATQAHGSSKKEDVLEGVDHGQA
ncbi:hypothetical protein BP5796_09890 [Coleophoma crateriformis]|uniref:Uncharacterized protein n=1 Tax=Coleophoma crateriformis TaxID=565419 RepID=A0A3D8QU38_9HELO|nr:hypothetical protein BP5796_09890 [Coleophoma crateriformis]